MAQDSPNPMKKYKSAYLRPRRVFFISTFTLLYCSLCGVAVFVGPTASVTAGWRSVECLQPRCLFAPTDPVVVNNLDNGAGSLRQAIADACDGSTITFNMATVTSPISLTTAELTINKNLTITGPGSTSLTIERSAARRDSTVPHL